MYGPTVADPTPIIQKLREIRTRENLALKPSPFLAPTFVDEYGDEHEVKIRNYQAQGIMNLLQVERMVLGDDTGLGKTLQVLSAIGYVWLVEPEYVPIIVTTKSALYQWAAETRKFMKSMEPVVADGEPYQRHNTYEEFFLRHDPSRKRLLLLTYDMIMKDADKSVIRDKDHEPSKEDKKALASARKAKSAAAEDLKARQTVWEAHFAQSTSYDKSEYMVKAMSRQPGELKDPPEWTDADRRVFEAFRDAKWAAEDAALEVQRLINVVTPPKTAPGLATYLRELRARHPGVKFMLVMDEMHKLKNHRSQFHLKCFDLSRECRRVVGMTATPVQNRLMEFWSLFHIIRPDLFPKITHFMNEFCVTKLQNIGGGRQVPVVVGYRNLDEFVRRIEPYYLSRKKHEVAKELPELISMEVECELSDIQEELYDLAETGLLDDMDEAEDSAALMLKSLTAVQQACNAPQLLVDEESGQPYEGPSGKVDKLLDILTEQAAGKKVIVFSRFEKMISLIEKALGEEKWTDESGVERKGIRCVRVTGKESDPKLREKAKQLFQDPRSGVNVVLITTAGSESINLQAAEHIVFVDLPWSWGVYVQLAGRAIRIGSQHVTVIAHHLLARKRNGDKTMDHDVLKALRGKKKLADKVAGESLQGGLQLVEDGDMVQDILAEMRKKAAVRAGDKKSLLAEVNAKLRASRREAEVKAASHDPGSKKKGLKKKEPAKPVVEDFPVATPDLDLSDI